MSENEDDIQQQAIDAANDLASSMVRLSRSIDEQKLYGRRNRLLIRILIAVTTFTVVLLILLGVVTVKAFDASDDAKEASSQATVSKEANYQTCISSNVARALQVDLWDTVLDTLGDRLPESGQFRTKVHTDFVQRECAH